LCLTTPTQDARVTHTHLQRVHNHILCVPQDWNKGLNTSKCKQTVHACKEADCNNVQVTDTRTDRRIARLCATKSHQRARKNKQCTTSRKKTKFDSRALYAVKQINWTAKPLYLVVVTHPSDVHTRTSSTPQGRTISQGEVHSAAGLVETSCFPRKDEARFEGEKCHRFLHCASIVQGRDQLSNDISLAHGALCCQ